MEMEQLKKLEVAKGHRLHFSASISRNACWWVLQGTMGATTGMVRVASEQGCFAVASLIFGYLHFSGPAHKRSFRSRFGDSQIRRDPKISGFCLVSLSTASKNKHKHTDIANRSFK